MGCRFSCAADFDAALVRARLTAGAFGPKRRRRCLLLTGAAGSLLIALLLLI